MIEQLPGRNGILIDLRFINIILTLSLSTIPKSWHWYFKTSNGLIINTYIGFNTTAQEDSRLRTFSIFILPVRFSISYLSKNPYKLYDPKKEKK